ncbi:hypothetical protein [Effusibacillus lacus]|uniref:Uncharacterized protein n=1 Tax=Effusibacillus lacus TaxID=1348429 RepID=A0A292YRQ0_9BACL|nr:hypothetical protein [Effusibacillus lacus]TCS74919.1 hypothetical protein EDD64_11043 [Effusibacillus lacus]GAX91591.1 hypothetical protein EFBL_3281 [Effusibacillus lacus]
MAKEVRETTPVPDIGSEVNEIAEYLELQVGPVTEAHKRLLTDLVQRYGAAAVTLTLVSEMSQLDMVTALLQQGKESLRKRKR